MFAQYCLEVKCLEDLQWKSRLHREIPDLYVEVKLGADVKRTRTIRKSRTPLWNEGLIFHRSDAFDAFSIRVLHDSKWQPDPCVGAVDITIADLLEASASGEACLCLLPPSKRKSTEPSGTVVLHLRSIDPIDPTTVADIAIRIAEDNIQGSGIGHSTRTLDTNDAIKDGASVGDGLYQPIGQLLERLAALTQVIDALSQIHPFVSIAWKLTSGLLKAVDNVFKADKKLVGLLFAMQDAYSFTCDTLSLPDKVVNIVRSIGGLVKQTIECCLFIGQYTRRGFARRMLDQNSNDKIDEFVQSLTGFKKEIESGVSLNTAFRTVRISNGIDEILLRQRLEPGQTDTSYRSVCLPGTRKEILQEITDWVFSDTDQNILWLHGVAGSGKSTISMTIAEYLRGLSRLGGLLMFQRGKSEPSTVIRTIAYKLALYDSRIGSRMVTDINEDKDIITATLATQFDKLLLQPLAAVSDSLPVPVAFVLDGLDECGTPDSRRGLLQLLRREFPKFAENIRFLITSRPEPDITAALSPQNEAIYIMELDYMSTASHNDVRSYLRSEMYETVAEKVGPKSVEDWNWDETASLLGKAAGGLFIFASTAVKMISRSDNPFRALEKLVSDTSSIVHFGLDDLYAAVLRDSGIMWSDDESRSRFADVLALVLLCKKLMTSETIDGILGYLPRESSLLILSRLRCLLSYSPGAPVFLFHASFYDYLTSPEREKDPWYIDIPAHQQFITTRCFDIMQDMLHFNMCDLGSSFVRNEDVPGLADLVGHLIPTHLEYACFYWINHLCDSQHSPDLIDKLSSLTYERLLFWFEILSLKAIFRRIASRALVDAATWVQAWDADPSMFLEESSRLAFDFGVPIGQSTPHIYTSMIPLTKDESIVSAHYSRRMSNLVHVDRYGIRRPSACVKVLEGHSLAVSSVAVSPRGTSIASASADKTVKVWDIISGEEVLALAHDSIVRSVGFSPDGSRLVSGCYDGALQVWDVSEGNLILGPLGRHTDMVNSVAYSPDGTKIASGSYDGTVIVWDALSGVVVAGPFLGHSEAVQTIGFSVDGSQVASGSLDGTLRIWDVATGELALEPFVHPKGVQSVAFCPTARCIASSCCWDENVRIWNMENGELVSVFCREAPDSFLCVAYSPCGTRIAAGAYISGTVTVWDASSGHVVSILKGHSDYVNSVGFTPDGKYIVSGSDDRTVRIWDAESRQVDHKESVHHMQEVTSVAFSPCGRWIASASYDRTIIIWNARSGKAVADPLYGHTDAILSVIFSSDGSRLVSGSWDKTIRIWDVESGKPVGEPLEGHSETVTCVALSPDGTQIASSSGDTTIRVWDMEQRKLVAGPLRGHSDYVRSITFSSDETRLASGSDDRTIRIWNTKTWETIFEPLRGHEGAVRCVCFSPDSTRIASCSLDSAVIVWDAETGQIIVGPFKEHDLLAFSVIFLPDESHLASSYSNGTIRLWNITSGQAVGDPLRGHLGEVTSLVVSPDGSRIASGSNDRTVREWDVSTMLQLAQNRTSTTNSISASPEQDLSDWILEKDGWILSGRDGHDLLCWIPPDLRRALWSPLNTNTAVCYEFSTKLDFTAAALGRRWTECFAI